MPADHGKQFTLYAHVGPNPWKVAIVLEELGLEYQITLVDSMKQEHKQKPYTDLCPNGRMPVLIDHANNDYTIWESGAIILYLVGKYDKEHKISFADFDKSMIANQYLMFQMSGQGPYFGQAVWFNKYHAEKIPSAIERYHGEILRVFSVLEGILEDKEYLVDNKVSYADISFLPWNALVTSGWMEGFEGLNEKFPKVFAWDAKLKERESVKKMEKAKNAALGR